MQTLLYKQAQRRYRRKPDVMAYDRERKMAANNPLRAAYRAIGLEAHNLAVKGKWRG